AVVKGVTPEQPAPVAAPAPAPQLPPPSQVAHAVLPPAQRVAQPEQGLFGRILRLFKRSAANESVGTAPAQRTPAAAAAEPVVPALPAAGDASRTPGRDERRRDGRGRDE